MSEDTRDLTVRIDSTEVSDIEVAAVTVAVAALTSGGALAPARDPHATEPDRPAWRLASLRESTGGQRVSTRTDLGARTAR